jgi:uncharacterized membrane protein
VSRTEDQVERAGEERDRDAVDFSAVTGWLRRRGVLRPARARPESREVGDRAGAEPDRDTVDFSAVTGWLRRRGVLRERAPRPPRPRAVAAARTAPQVGADQLALFDAPAAGAVDAEVDAEPRPAWQDAGPWQDWDWTPDADSHRILADPLARAVMVTATVAYIVLFSYWTIRHHEGYGTQAFDFGIYDQGLWLLSRFKSPFVTIMGRQLFGDHTSFILLPLVPVYWVYPSAKVLLFVQAAALGSAAVPTFLLAREKLRDERLAAAMAVVYLLHPSVAFINLEQFHPDVFEVPLLMFALWFMVRKRWLGFLLCVVGALMVKEDVALFTLGLGVYVAFRHDRRAGLAACALSGLAMAAALWWILPALNGVGSLNAWRVPFGGLRGLVATTVTRPWEVVHYAFGPGRPWYVWQMFAPVAFMPLLAPRFLLVGLAPLAANVLSTFYYQYDIHYHYGTLIMPVLMGGTILGIAHARSMAGRRVLAGVVVASSLVTAYLWGPLPIGRDPAAIADPHANSVPHLAKMQELIPKDAVLSAFYGYVPHFDHRQEIYMFPNPFKASYWGTFKQEGQRLPAADRVEYVLVPTVLDPEPKAILDSIRGEFETVYEEGNVTLLKRRAP